MSACTIYHNPRCSKSRQTLALLEERGVACDIINYLETPPSADTLLAVVTALDMRPYELLRRKEPQFKALDITAETPDPTVIDAMVRYPALIERPIVVVGEKAAIGRPPENVLALFAR